MEQVTHRVDRAVVHGAAEASGNAGASWALGEQILLGVVLAALASLLPLYDPDLPMHLAIGEWIVQHRSVPLVEPFAWTREGDPFYAYSWLPETLFYVVHSTFGPGGLRLLQGLMIGLVFGSSLAAARLMGLRAGPGLFVAAFSVLVAAIVTPSLRPQIVLLITVPLIWAVLYRVRAGARMSAMVPALVALSAISANSHLFFPITLAPAAVLLVPRLGSAFRLAGSSAAIVAGWLLTPYLPHWVDMLQANLAPNAILDWPSPIAELQPGFVAVARLEHVVLAPAILLAALPWGVSSGKWSSKTTFLAATYWLIGLVAFGFAMRLLAIWWLLVLPFAGRVLMDWSSGEPDAPPRPAVKLFAYSALLVLLALSVSRAMSDWRREGTVGTRRLATTYARTAEPLAGWLQQHAPTATGGRIYTVFNYGSYLTWRLPEYSPSIDGRALFPDSVARAETLVPVALDTVVLGPWRSADLAIVPLDRVITTVLDTATGWQRVAESHSIRRGVTPAGLWVRKDWWSAVSSFPLPERPLVLSDSAPSPAHEE